jgi:hypothetical protein
MAARKSKAQKLKVGLRFNRVTATWVAAVMVVVGVYVILVTHAAGGGQLYFTPSGTQAQPGSLVNVTIREESLSTPVNAVQADVLYDPNLLEYVSTDGTASAFGIAAPITRGTGVVSIARGTITPVTGDQVVAKLTFRLKSGSSTLSFRSTSAVLDSNTNASILGGTGTATIAVLSPTPTPTSAPADAPTPAPTAAPTPRPTAAPVDIDSESSGTDNSSHIITLTAPAAITPNTTTSYTVDGNAVDGNTVDANQLSDGTHTVQAVTVDANKSVVAKTTSTIKVNTKKSFWQNAVLVAKENLATVVVLVLVIAVVIGGYFLYRRNIQGANYMAWPS